MRPHPRVSVIIPAYDCESRIGSTLERLRGQSHTDFEAVVVNDGSRDRTAVEVRRAMESDSRIRLVEQASNTGIAAARNAGVAAARGELLAFLDDDDWWVPRKLEHQLARLHQVPDARVVSCYSALVDPSGTLLGWRFGGRTEGNVYAQMLEWDMVSGGSVVLVARRAFEAVGGFDESLPYRADWDLWIRLARRHRFTSVPRVLVGYTRRPGSISRNHEQMLEQGRAVLTKARREDASISADRHRALLARDQFAIFCLCLVDDEWWPGWGYLARSLRGSPGFILMRPRRLGAILLQTLATVLPPPAYRYVLSMLSRVVFRLERGGRFDALE